MAGLAQQGVIFVTSRRRGMTATRCCEMLEKLFASENYPSVPCGEHLPRMKMCSFRKESRKADMQDNAWLGIFWNPWAVIPLLVRRKIHIHCH